ncbi:anti-sigma factor RsbA family regulatory protein [Catellatospora sp. NPDC049609]|uniref:anti-sigma factor RsbA family regulatory protein n=1 Tax=Catellatospora sp. NPDC049609 TaxID=3155505 RepID=UPI003428AB53
MHRSALPAPRQLTHDAVFYTGEREFVGALAPFVEEGLADGDAVIVAVPAPHTALLRTALGGAGRRVTYIDRDECYRRPAATIAGWQRLLGEARGSGHRHVRVIGEVAFGVPGRHQSWTRYEAALNELFAGEPAWIVCPYDTAAHTPAVLADARRTHQAVFDPVRRPSDAYVAPRQLLAELVEPAPAVDGPPAVSIDLRDVASIGVARHGVAAAAAAHGVGLRRIEDLQLVCSELTANSIRHGAGARRLRLWLAADSVIGEVTDEGGGIGDLLAGYQAPPQGTAGGWGLWISSQLCEEFSIARDGATTRVRFRMAF